MLFTHGARYLSQLVSRSANLSAPNRIGATVNAIRSSQKAWYVGSDLNRSILVSRPVGAAAAVLAVMTLPFLLTDTTVDVRTRASLTSTVMSVRNWHLDRGPAVSIKDFASRVTSIGAL